MKKINAFRVNFRLNRPVYHITDADGLSISKFADTGVPVAIDQEKALDLAVTATGNSHHATVERLEELDQWVPRPKYLKHLPIYNVTFDDGIQVYISSLSGEVISLTSDYDRFWAWTGAIPHWVYFTSIRLRPTLWYQLVSWLAGLGFIMVVTGVITGLARFKKKPNAKFKRFKNKWYNYHYYFGLAFGLFVCTWVFSGFMSMTPFNWTPSTNLKEENMLKWQKSDFTLNSFTTQRWHHLTQHLNKHQLREIDFCLFNNTLFARTHTKNALIPLDEIAQVPSISNYKNIIKTFSSTEKITEAVTLSAYDNYYYSRHNNKHLPIIRITTSTDVAYYINPLTTEMVYKCSTKNRIERWLYHGLHSLDFSFLTSKGILWDGIMIFLLLGGTILSLTATGLGVKFIGRKIKKQLKNSTNEKKATKNPSSNSVSNTKPKRTNPLAIKQPKQI